MLNHKIYRLVHVDPKKSKTKCMAFQRRRKDIKCMKLNGKALPWVSPLSHLGSTITDDCNCRMHQDTLEKRAIYISRNNELNQEFYFSHPKTKVWANDRLKNHGMFRSV